MKQCECPVMPIQWWVIRILKCLLRHWVIFLEVSWAACQNLSIIFNNKFKREARTGIWVQHRVSQAESESPHSSSWEHEYFANVQDNQWRMTGLASISSCCPFSMLHSWSANTSDRGAADPDRSAAAEEAPPSLPSLVSEGRFWGKSQEREV